MLFRSEAYRTRGDKICQRQSEQFFTLKFFSRYELAPLRVDVQCNIRNWAASERSSVVVKESFIEESGSSAGKHLLLEASHAVSVNHHAAQCEIHKLGKSRQRA